jgi:6-phosphogluconolactonase
MRNVLMMAAVMGLACWPTDPPPGLPPARTMAGSGGPLAVPPTPTGGAAGAAGGTGGTTSAGGAGGSVPGGAGTGGRSPVDDAAPAGGEAAVAPDGRAADAPAAAAANPFVYVGSGGSDEIRIFQLDLATGALSPRGSAASGPSPDYLAFHPSRNLLYALNEVAAGRVVAFSVNPATGALTLLNSQPSGGSGPAHISVHKSGRWLLAANYGSGHAAALPILEDGRLGPPVAPVLAGAAAHMILDDGVSGRFVFVPSKGTNRTLQYRFDDQTGRLEPNDPPFVAQAGAPRHMTFHRSGRYAFLLTEAGRSVISYRYDAATGLLGGAQPLPVPARTGRADGAHVRLHPTREILYASIRFDDRIAIFDIDADGRARAPRFVETEIARPWDFDIDASGRYLLVANNDSASVKVFRIDERGGLSLVGPGATVAPRPRFVGLFSPRLP